MKSNNPIPVQRRVSRGVSRGASRGGFYGWWVVFAGFAALMLASGLGNQSGGLYMVVLQEEFGWTKAAISGVFALGAVQAAVLAPLQGRLIDRFGPRAIVSAGFLIMGAGLIGVSTINSIAAFTVYGLMIGLGVTLALDVAPHTAVVNWFKRKRAAAIGLMMTGLGAGGALVPVFALSMTGFGWRRAILLGGIAVMVVGTAAAQLLRRSPEECGLQPDGESSDATEEGCAGAEVMKEFTVCETLRTPSFWFLAFYHAMFSFGVTAVAMHLVPYAVENLDVSLTIAGSLMTLLTVCMVVGYIFGGFVGDRVHKRKLMIVLTTAQVGALALVVFGGTPPFVIVFAILQGLIVGARAPLNFSLRAEYFGRKSYGTIWGISLAIVNIGNMAGIMATGFLADYFGRYKEAFILILILTGVSILLLALAKRPKVSARAVADG